METDTMIDALRASGPRPDLAGRLMLFGQFVGGWEVDITNYGTDGTATRPGGRAHRRGTRRRAGDRVRYARGSHRLIGDLFAEVFGDAERHARLAIGVAALPYDVAVNVEGVFEAF